MNTYWNYYFFYELPRLTATNAPVPTWIWIAVAALAISVVGVIIWMIIDW